MKPQRNPEMTPELLSEIAKANPRRLAEWSQEFEANGRVVLHTSILKTLGFAVVAWLFVASIVTLFTVLPLS